MFKFTSLSDLLSLSKQHSEMFRQVKAVNTFKLFRMLGIVFCTIFLMGCSNITLTNPFIITPQEPIASGTYFGKFKNIPIPVDMTLDESRTYIATSLEGKVMGLETYEGKVEISAIANDMSNIMQREGWALRGSVSVTKTMQLYENDGLFAIIYYYNQALSTAMEIWVMNALPYNYSSVTYSPAQNAMGQMNNPNSSMYNNPQNYQNSQQLQQNNVVLPDRSGPQPLFNQ